MQPNLYSLNVYNVQMALQGTLFARSLVLIHVVAVAWVCYFHLLKMDISQIVQFGSETTFHADDKNCWQGNWARDVFSNVSKTSVSTVPDSVAKVHILYESFPGPAFVENNDTNFEKIELLHRTFSKMGEGNVSYFDVTPTAFDTLDTSIITRGGNSMGQSVGILLSSIDRLQKSLNPVFDNRWLSPTRVATVPIHDLESFMNTSDENTPQNNIVRSGQFIVDWVNYFTIQNQYNAGWQCLSFETCRWSSVWLRFPKLSENQRPSTLVSAIHQGNGTSDMDLITATEENCYNATEGRFNCLLLNSRTSKTWTDALLQYHTVLLSISGGVCAAVLFLNYGSLWIVATLLFLLFMNTVTVLFLMEAVFGITKLPMITFGFAAILIGISFDDQIVILNAFQKKKDIRFILKHELPAVLLTSVLTIFSFLMSFLNGDGEMKDASLFAIVSVVFLFVQLVTALIPFLYLRQSVFRANSVSNSKPHYTEGIARVMMNRSYNPFVSVVFLALAVCSFLVLLLGFKASDAVPNYVSSGSYMDAITSLVPTLPLSHPSGLHFSHSCKIEMSIPATFLTEENKQLFSETGDNISQSLEHVLLIRFTSNEHEDPSRKSGEFSVQSNISMYSKNYSVISPFHMHAREARKRVEAFIGSIFGIGACGTVIEREVCSYQLFDNTNWARNYLLSLLYLEMLVAFLLWFVFDVSGGIILLFLSLFNLNNALEFVVLYLMGYEIFVYEIGVLTLMNGMFVDYYIHSLLLTKKENDLQYTLQHLFPSIFSSALTGVVSITPLFWSNFGLLRFIAAALITGYILNFLSSLFVLVPFYQYIIKVPNGTALPEKEKKLYDVMRKIGARLRRFIPPFA